MGVVKEAVKSSRRPLHASANVNEVTVQKPLYDFSLAIQKGKGKNVGILESFIANIYSERHLNHILNLESIESLG